MQVWTTLERLFRNHLARLITKRTTFFESFFIMDAFWGIDKFHNSNFMAHSPFTTHHSRKRFAFTLAEVFSPHFVDYRKAAFTLAEVLITLGIIGVVAAMTLPTLTLAYKKSVIETSLKKFYSNSNQAIKLATVKYGDPKEWTYAEANDADSILEFYNKYLNENLKTLKVEKSSDNKQINVYFADGSGVKIGYKGKSWFYCINAQNLDKVNNNENDKANGVKCFGFGFYADGACPKETYAYKNYYNKGVEPGMRCEARNADGSVDTENPRAETEEDVKVLRSAAAKLIQLNGWKIPDDYPHKL